MHCAGPPRAGRAQGRTLRLSAARCRVFDGSSAAALDPALRLYLSDLVRPYGLALRADLLDAGSGHSYGEMAGALLTEAIPAEQPVDLIVLAFAIPDVIPGRSTAAHLSHLCPGSPLAFAICDQGAAAPFTALRLISAYAETGSCRSALLVVVEQSALHYELAAPAPVPARHAAVALLFGESGPGSLETVRQHADVDPAQASGLLADELAALSHGRSDVTLVAGSGLAATGAGPAGPGHASRAELIAGSSSADLVLMAPSGQPCTGVWWELAGGLPGWMAAGRRVLLADYEPMTGCLCVSAIDIDARPAESRPGLTAQRAQ